MLGAILGQAGAGEQTLLKRLVKRRPGLFAGRVTCFDRNFRAPRGALAYRPRSGYGLEEVFVGLMAYLDP
jgi:ABC-type molybdenum transport system ATPase subunit/photorepair protein PhrA